LHSYIDAYWDTGKKRRVANTATSETLFHVNEEDVNNILNKAVLMPPDLLENKLKSDSLNNNNLLVTTNFSTDNIERYINTLNQYAYIGEEQKAYDNSWGGKKRYISYYKFIDIDNYDNGLSIKKLLNLNGVSTSDFSLSEMMSQAISNNWNDDYINELLMEKDLVEYVDTGATTVSSNQCINISTTVKDSYGETLGYLGTTGKVIVGINQLLPEVEDALIGSKVGDTIEVDAIIPEDNYSAGEYAGKRVHFSITVNSIIGEYNFDAVDESTYQDVQAELWDTMKHEIAYEILANGFDVSKIAVYDDIKEINLRQIKNYYVDYYNDRRITEKEFAENYLGVSVSELQEYYSKMAELQVSYDYIVGSLDEFKILFDRIKENNPDLSFEEMKDEALEAYVGEFEL